jgi:hypothetical protein
MKICLLGIATNVKYCDMTMLFNFFSSSYAFAQFACITAIIIISRPKGSHTTRSYVIKSLLGVSTLTIRSWSLYVPKLPIFRRILMGYIISLSTFPHANSKTVILSSEFQTESTNMKSSSWVARRRSSLA